MASVEKVFNSEHEKARLDGQGIPEPVTALGAPIPRKNKIRKALLHLVALAAVVQIGCALFKPTLGPAHDVEHVHKDLKPKGPLKPDEAKELFLTVPNPSSALAASRIYATHPHLAGSNEDLADAKVILQLFQSEFNIVSPPEDQIFTAGSLQSRAATLGASNLTAPAAWIDTYYPVMNTGLERSLSILNDDGSTAVALNIEEIGDIRDPEAEKYKDSIPAWHGLSADGDVTGEIVYANYGSFDDYAKLEEQGVDLKGKIALVRYGSVFRGLKIKRAEELGAAGVLIYSDPRDDGYVIAENGFEPYPSGPARNPSAVQRGSVQYLSFYPGDPTTPGVPAYQNATRIEGGNVPKIPSLPISWANAQILLKELGGNDEGRQISGKLSGKKIRLMNHVDSRVIPIWNTYAAIPGHIRDEVVLIGCHRDAWVMGAADPTSGTVSVHEIVRGLGHLLRNGWRPMRTIVLASWDAEEYGLIGSTEWGEDFPEWIQKHVVSYLNVDVSVSGSRYHLSGSPSLAHVLRAAAEKVSHPTKANSTLWDARGDSGPFQSGEMDTAFAATYAEQLDIEARQAAQTGINPLGSGSDYTVFLQRLGVASSDEGFGFTATDAVYHYHSIYDSQHWQETFADPGFHRHVAVAKHLGLTALTLTDSIILPLNTTQYAHELDSYLDRVEEIASSSELDSAPNFKNLRKSIHQLQHTSHKMDHERHSAEHKFHKALKRLEKWHRKHSACGGRSGFKNWFKRTVKRVFGVTDEFGWRHRADRIHARYDELFELVRRVEGGESLNAMSYKGKPKMPGPLRDFIKAALRVRKVNQQLIAFERGFIHEDGIKDRSWYRHLGVAPGKWLGYGATTLPGVTEALTYDKDVKAAEKEADKLASLLNEISEKLHP